jgi:NhaP-type Na+/H+ or K+/H+ antiporter
MRAIVGKNVKTLTLIAPRGLITILLFFSIPVAFQQDAFDPGILLYVIILSSLLMTYALIDDKKQKLKLEAQQDKEEIELDSVNPEISKQINEILGEDDSDNSEKTKD